MEIGKKLKDIRMKNGLTQEELADRSELTKGFISQVERDLASPSIDTLIELLQCLGTTPADFFADSTGEQIVFTEEDYFEKVEVENGTKIKWIVPNAQKNLMEPIVMELAPGGQSMKDNPHDGEEFGYVIKGKITIKIGSKEYEASEGESFYFIPNKEHYIKADETGEAEVLWVTTPPNF